MTLKTMKVLDVQWGTPKMPNDIKKFFFKYCRDNMEFVGNDVWVEYTICPEYDVEDVEDEKLNILDNWLLQNTDVELGEEILLKHWW